MLAVIAADRASAKYDIEHTPEKQAQIKRDREREALLEQNKTAVQRAKEWATDNRYPLLFGFWVASMAGSWHLVNRNRYLSGSQKLVTARMYAQGLTLGALLTSFAFEGSDAAKGKGRWETIKVIDPTSSRSEFTTRDTLARTSGEVRCIRVFGSAVCGPRLAIWLQFDLINKAFPCEDTADLY
jgi:hypothetical protein